MYVIKHFLQCALWGNLQCESEAGQMAMVIVTQLDDLGPTVRTHVIKAKKEMIGVPQVGL